MGREETCHATGRETGGRAPGRPYAPAPSRGVFLFFARYRAFMSSSRAADEAAAAAAACDAVCSEPFLVENILNTLLATDLVSCAQVCRLWRKQAAVAARVWTAQQAPAIAAALRDTALSPGACLAVACRAVKSLALGVRNTPETRAAALSDYALLLTVHDGLGEAVCGVVLPLCAGDFMTRNVYAGGEVSHPVRAVSLPPVPPELPRAPQQPPLGLLGLRHTGERDVRDLLLSVDVIRHSTAEIARLWSSESPTGLCSYADQHQFWQSTQHGPALLFQLRNSIPHGKLGAPASFMDPLMGNYVRALHLDAYVFLQPVASSPAGAKLCLLPRAAVTLHHADIGAAVPVERDAAVASEVLAVLLSLDWEPLLPAANAEADTTADIAALNLEPDAGAKDSDAVACKLYWPAHADALEQLMQNPPAARPHWLSSLPRRPFAALLTACDAAAEEPPVQRFLRLMGQFADSDKPCHLQLLVELHVVGNDPPRRMDAPLFGAAGLLYGTCNNRVSTVDAEERNSYLTEAFPPGRLALLRLDDNDPRWAVHRRASRLMLFEHDNVQAFVWLLRHNDDGSLQVAQLAHHLPLKYRSGEPDHPGGAGCDVMFTEQADALANSTVQTYMVHPPHLIMHSSLIKTLRQDQGNPEPLVPSFQPQFLTFGLDLLFGDALDPAATGFPSGVLVRQPNGMMLRMGMELRPSGGGEPALYANMACLDEVARRLDWSTLLPPSH